METITVVPGKWSTRNQRLAIIDQSFEVEDAPQPGMPKVKRMVWGGMMYLADGKTPESRSVWEQDGRNRTPQGVATQYDLCALIEAAPVAA